MKTEAPHYSYPRRSIHDAPEAPMAVDVPILEWPACSAKGYELFPGSVAAMKFGCTCPHQKTDGFGVITANNCPLHGINPVALDDKTQGDLAPIIRPEFPALKSQAEIDAEEFEFSPLAYVVMFSAAASVALIIAGFNWFVGAW